MRESQHDGPEPRLGLTFAPERDGTVSWHQPVADQFVDPSGRFATGGLAVLVDSGLGSENHRRRPSGMWTVTTELRIDLLRRPRAGSTGLGIRTDYLGDDGHCLTTRGDVVDDDGEVVAAGLIKSMEIAGAVDPDGYDDEPPWPSRLVRGTLAEVLCMTIGEPTGSGCGEPGGGSGAGPGAGSGGARVLEAVIAPEPTLANPLGNLHGGVFAAAAEVVGSAVFPHEREVSSSSLDVRYVRQIPLVGPVTVRAEVLHEGRSWGIAQVTTRDDRGRICAVAMVTVYGRR